MISMVMHCDGKRRRRNSPNRGKRLWYSYYRGVRFSRRFGIQTKAMPTPSLVGFVIYLHNAPR